MQVLIVSKRNIRQPPQPAWLLYICNSSLIKSVSFQLSLYGIAPDKKRRVVCTVPYRPG